MCLVCANVMVKLKAVASPQSKMGESTLLDDTSFNYTHTHTHTHTPHFGGGCLLEGVWKSVCSEFHC